MYVSMNEQIEYRPCRHAHLCVCIYVDDIKTNARRIYNTTFYPMIERTTSRIDTPPSRKYRCVYDSGARWSGRRSGSCRPPTEPECRRASPPTASDTAAATLSRTSSPQ